MRGQLRSISGRIAWRATAHGFIEMQEAFRSSRRWPGDRGIGASFDTPEHDVQIAQAGLAALSR